MATPNVLQSRSGNSAANNPNLAYTANIKAGSLLVACIVQQVGDLVPPPTDSKGNSWRYIQSDQEYGTASHCCGFYFAYANGAGQNTVQFVTDAPSAYAIAEVSNIASSTPTGLTAIDGKAFDTTGGGSAGGASIALDYVLHQAGELLVGCVLIPSDASITLPSGVTVAQTQQSTNGSLALVWGIAPSVTSGTYTFTQSGVSDYCAYFGAFYHA